MQLSKAQVTQYEQDGYLLLRGLIEEKDLVKYDARFREYVMSQRALPADMKIMQDVMVVKGEVNPETPVHSVNKLLCLENDDVLFSFAHHPELVSAVQSLLGTELYTVSSNVFNKPPGVDGRHPMHQDLRYFRLRPASGIVGVWTAMLPATREHGCLAVIPGTHRGDLLDHANPDWDFVNHGFFGIDGIDLEQRVHMEMEPGDTLLFHPLIVHGSGRNRTEDFRRAISIHYAAGSCESPKENWQNVGLTRRIS
ncbi:MAG: hypothetical protein GKR90_03755 [Pseudomonadales bacterium]|nr:hypothetical protein [Pseudomonadales bacterium]